MRTVRTQAAPQASVPQTAPRIARRPHVTVRTPRYYRRNMANVIKKPSTLCLPLSCQPDPACYRRVRRHPEEPSYPSQLLKHSVTKELSRRHSVPMQMTLPVDQDQREVHMTQSDVDAVLARYDTIFQGQGLESPSEKCESMSSKASSKPKMVPKIPIMIKKQQERLKRGSKRSNSSKESKKQNKTDKTVENLHVEEITPEVLDNMLTELMNSENKQNEITPTKDSPRPSSQTTYDTKNGERNNNVKNNSNVIVNSISDSSNQYYQGFNYQDISCNMPKTPTPYNKSGSTTTALTSSGPRSPRFDCPNISLQPNQPLKPKLSNSEIQSDDNGVMELHRSKSYIVNLIDRALSKELGTIPDETFTSAPKELNSMNTRQAACTMRKHDKRCENGFCLEISQMLSDPHTANAPTPSLANDAKHDHPCTCSVQDEPLYIKQLRQLRWGHLKHIQMEVRRLEDLERFLDACTTPSSR